jgi:hypothetical protein
MKTYRTLQRLGRVSLALATLGLSLCTAFAIAWSIRGS